MIRGFQQGLATGKCHNLSEYKPVDVDFVLGIHVPAKLLTGVCGCCDFGNSQL